MALRCKTSSRPPHYTSFTPFHPPFTSQVTKVIPISGNGGAPGQKTTIHTCRRSRLDPHLNTNYHTSPPAGLRHAITENPLIIAIPPIIAHMPFYRPTSHIIAHKKRRGWIGDLWECIEVDCCDTPVKFTIGMPLTFIIQMLKDEHYVRHH